MAGFFAYERIVARDDFPRWALIPAAFAINICAGSTYAFSVFNLPLTRVFGITSSAPDDWKLSTVGWIFTLTYVFFGLAVGLLGRWQDRVGPRVSGIAAALLRASGFFVSALGVQMHSLTLLYLGCGVLGGCGAGLGFTTPVTPLLKWYPDKRGLAMGFAVVGFGGGGIVAAPLSQWLMQHFATPTSVGVVPTFVILGSVFLVAMLAGALTLRVPPPGWRPAGWKPSVVVAQAATRYVPADTALHTRQFYLLWSILLINATAGFGVAGQAAPMIQEVFNGFSAVGAAAFVAMLSFFNMGGRLVWAWASDKSSRRLTFATFFLIAPVIYALVPVVARAGQLPLFIACFATAMTFLGGGFALMPSYVADIFGTKEVNAIHGRVLTALSVAGVAGPVLVNYLREFEIGLGIAPARAYDHTMYIMAGLLAVGFFCNYAVGPVEDRCYIDEKIEMAPALMGRPDERYECEELGLGK